MNKYKVDFTVGTANNTLSRGSIKASSLLELKGSMESICKLVELANSAKNHDDERLQQPLEGNSKLRIKFSNSKCTTDAPDLDILLKHSNIDPDTIAA